MNDGNIDRLAKILWNYHHMNQPLKKADAILALGSHDIRTADRAVELFEEGWAPLIIFSGDRGSITKGMFEKPEAEVFADIAIKLGVPKEKIIIEGKSTNTGENIIFTRRLLEEKGLNFNSFIVVQKPYMERRTFATFKKQWPGKDFIVTSLRIEYDKYFNERYPKDYVIDVMVGDTQRIIEYPKLGYQIKQDVPKKVLEAFNQLIKLGYTKHLIK